jgi:hypothetical protein
VQTFLKMWMRALVFLFSATIFGAEGNNLYRRINIPAKDIVYDAARSRILVSAGSPTNSILSVDPVTGELGNVLQLPFEPGTIALSSDGNFLYVTESTPQHVFRIQVSPPLLDPDFSITLRDTVSEFITVVNQPGTIIIADRQGVRVFDGAVARPLQLTGNSQVSRSEDPLVFYQSTASRFLRRLDLVADGLQIGRETAIPAEAAATRFTTAGGWVLYSSGHGTTGNLLGRAEPGANRVSGQLPVLGPSLPNPAASRLYFLTSPQQPFFFPTAVLRAFSSVTFKEQWSVGIAEMEQFPVKLIQTSPGQAAVTVRPSSASNPVLYLTLLNLNSVPTDPIADVKVSSSRSVTNAMVGRRVTVTCGITNQGPWTATAVESDSVFPSGLRFEYATNMSAGVSATVTNGIVQAKLPELLNGNGVSMAFVFTVLTNGDQSITTTVRHGEPDSLPSNNVASVAITGVSVPRITLRDGSVTEGEVSRTGPLITLSNPVPERIDYFLMGRSGTATAFEDGGAADFRMYVSGTGIPAGQTSNIASWILIDDALIEPPETLFMTLVVSSDFIVERAEATVTIYDNDYPTVSISASEANEGPHGETNSMSFMITYAPKLETTLAVSYYTMPETAVPNVDYIPIQGRVEFPPGVTNVLVTVPIIGDNELEPTESFIVVLEKPERLKLSSSVSGRGLILNYESPLKITEAKVVNEVISITFASVAGAHYQLQWKSDLTASWSNRGEPIVASGATMTVTHSIGDAQLTPNAFFRITTVQ